MQHYSNFYLEFKVRNLSGTYNISWYEIVNQGIDVLSVRIESQQKKGCTLETGKDIGLEKKVLCVSAVCLCWGAIGCMCLSFETSVSFVLRPLKSLYVRKRKRIDKMQNIIKKEVKDCIMYSIVPSEFQHLSHTNLNHRRCRLRFEVLNNRRILDGKNNRTSGRS